MPGTFFKRWDDDQAAGESLPTTVHAVCDRVRRTLASVGYRPRVGEAATDASGVVGLDVDPRTLRTKKLSRKKQRSLVRQAQNKVASLREALRVLFQAKDLIALEGDVTERRVSAIVQKLSKEEIANLEREEKSGGRELYDRLFPHSHEISWDRQDRYNRTLDEIGQELVWLDDAIVKDQRVPWQKRMVSAWRSGFQRAGLGDGLTAAAMREAGFKVADDPEAARDAIRKQRKRGDKTARK